MKPKPFLHPSIAALLLWSATACGGHTFVEGKNAASTPLLFQRVRVFDARVAALREGMFDVLVKDGRIVSVSAQPLSVPGAVEAGRGGVLLPGLLDLHAHHDGGMNHPKHLELPKASENLGAYLFAGVTGVLDVGSMTPAVFETRAALASGKVVGPTLWAAGPIFTAPGGHPAALVDLMAPPLVGGLLNARLVRTVTSAAEAKQHVDALVADHAPDVIKIAVDRIPLDANRLAPDLAKAVVDAAHAHNTRVVAHIGSSQDAQDAAQAGVDALVHGVQMDAVTDAALDALVVHKVAVVPTLSVYQALLRMLDDKPVYSPMELAIGRKQTLQHLSARPTGMEGHALVAWLLALKAGQPHHHANVKRMLDRGIPILVGSDSANVNHFPGAGLHSELGELVKAGMSPGQVLAAATLANARFLTRQEDPPFGLVEEGKQADLVLFRSDPTVDINASQDITAVVKGGVLYARKPRAP